MLPIDEIQPQFVDALEQGSVIVEASTGSGKSTRLPVWCMSRGKVLVVQPRRLAARSLARYVASQVESELGQKVGYAVRFDTQYSKQTELVFVTPGIALRMFAENGLSDFACVVLDEFHERRWDTDLLAAMLKQRLASRSSSKQNQRLIITSATIEAGRLANYFNAQRLHAEGRRFPVDIHYTEQRDLPRIKHLEQRVVTAIEQQLKQNQVGDILVFLPGKAEIASVQAALKCQQTVIPLHADVDKRCQDQALTPGEQQKVILATNVAETSLTIPGVTVVIDSGLERRTHHRNARTVLGLHSISQAAADQRAGRAGRLGPGKCVRLWGQHAKLEAHTPAEIEREELTELVLTAAAAGVDVQQLEFPSTPPQHALDRAIELLQKMDALDRERCITEHGRRLFPLPIDALFAHLISAMPDQDTRAAMIDLSAALSVNRSLLGKLDNEKKLQALNEWQPEPCDISTLIALVRESAPKAIPVVSTVLKQARQIAQHIHAALQSQMPKQRQYPRERLLKAIYQAAPDLLYVRRAKRLDALGNGFSEVEVGRESRFTEQAQAALVLDQHHSAAKGLSKTINKATCMAPLSFTDLNDWQVGELEFAQLAWDGERVNALLKRVYAGREIGEFEQRLTGDDLRRAVASLILRGSMMKGLGSQIKTDIAAWNLYLSLQLDRQSLHEFSETKPWRSEDWLQQRLLALGVEEDQDLQLIEQSDLAFDGIPEWEREEFDQKYPRQIALSDLLMQVEYDNQRRSILLTKLQGIRKMAPKRLELPVWQGWRIQYRDGSKVVDIR